MKKQIIATFSMLVVTEVGAQVGINTTSPQGALDVYSTTSGMVIPRLPNPQSISSPVEGMLAYDSTNKTIRYYDGANWSTLVYSKEQTKSNEGVVKINAGGNGAGNKPSWTNVSANTVKQITYNLPLVYATPPTTSWPDNSANFDSKVYAGNRFLENAVKGQVHQWRVIVNYTKSANIYSQDVRLILRNPTSGFISEMSGVIPSSKTSGSLVYNLTTIADVASLPAPVGTGTGYVLEWVASDTMNSLSVDSITRISFQKN
ncbi:hypothetical protein [Chryseobacterium sp. JUb7]|uniref:hypothetical protein n=1 Tax=Chryseobacterium sp. JUb7 TaxID=2940599 RepID=UPI002168A463|nr:hypothetical protein [Chryseobacterium sp. JUb7]MCS3529552.1 hypothetical protein [Chryseobacterium sp. JUb7]